MNKLTQDITIGPVILNAGDDMADLQDCINIVVEANADKDAKIALAQAELDSTERAINEANTALKIIMDIQAS